MGVIVNGLRKIHAGIAEENDIAFEWEQFLFCFVSFLQWDRKTKLCLWTDKNSLMKKEKLIIIL